MQRSINIRWLEPAELGPQQVNLMESQYNHDQKISYSTEKGNITNLYPAFRFSYLQKDINTQRQLTSVNFERGVVPVTKYLSES